MGSCSPKAPPSSSTSHPGSEGTNQTTSSLSEGDFAIKTADNGLSAEKGSYSFANAPSDDQYPPEAVIHLNTDSTWELCTALNERMTRIIIEDPEVVPNDAVELEPIREQDVIGAGGDNHFVGFDLVFDRHLLTPGTTRLKLELQPGNGNSTMNVLTGICLEIEIEEYGTIAVDVYEIDFNVDLSGLSAVLAEESENPTSISFSLTDTAPLSEVYGYTADYSVQVDVPLDEPDGTASITGFRFAVGHVYRAQLFVEGEKASDRIWFSLEAASGLSSYSLTPNPGSGNSLLEVYEDGARIEAVLGGYFAL